MFDVNLNPDAAFAALDLTPGVQGASRDASAAELLSIFQYNEENCILRLDHDQII